MPPQRQPFRRILLKLSGESFSGKGGSGIAEPNLRHIAGEIVAAHAGTADRTHISVVVGGGNIVRGAALARANLINQATADAMGMLGTIVNALALREAIQDAGQDARVMAAVHIPGVVDRFDRCAAIEHLDAGRVLVIGGGTGNPFFTTDTAAALRAAELQCDAILKATTVDGVYSADPATNPDATRYDHLTLTEAINQRLGVMDLTALAMCQAHAIPVVVFDFGATGNIKAVAQGKPVGTLVSPD